MTNAPSETLVPERFVLSYHQLAAALALGGLSPSSRSALPSAPPPSNPRGALTDTSVLGSDGALTSAARTALEVAADPQRMLTVMTNRAGRRAWTETTFVQAGGNGGPAVAQALREGEADLALLPTPAQALVTLDELLGITALPGRPSNGVLHLDLAAYAAALATADHVQEARLQARLARERRPLPALTAESLEAQLARGLESNDTRWAVTAARAVCPANLVAAQGQLDGGLRRLAEVGLLSRDGERMAPTERGIELFVDLAQIVNSAGLLLAAAERDEPAAVAHMTLLRCTNAIWFAAWRGITESDGEIELYQSTPIAGLKVLEGLLEPAALPTAG